MMKRRFVSVLASILALGALGCASGGGATEGRGTAVDPEGLVVMDEETLFRPRVADALLETLPEAPWEAAPISDRVAADGVVAAWRQAENRAHCAPLSLDAESLAGAEARIVDLEGGWSVEFDRPGMPGMTEEGGSCATCGRGVFGVAGTGMQTDELEEDPALSYRDGSGTEVVVDPSGLAAATLAIHGQSCVYQVWSFLGEEHLRSLLGTLRFVAVTEADSAARVAGLGFE